MPDLAIARLPPQAYLDTIAATLECVVTTTVNPLREPVAVRPERAFKIVGLVVETVAGFAIGSVAGELARGLRGWFGSDGDGYARRMRDAVKPARTPPCASVAGFLDDAETRPLVDELGAQLQLRLRLAASEIRELVAATTTAVPLDRERTLAAMFDRLTRESRFGDQLAETIVIGWQCACAAIEHAPMPELPGSPRVHALWRAWAELVGMYRPAPAREPLQEAGYITLVR